MARSSPFPAAGGERWLWRLRFLAGVLRFHHLEHLAVGAGAVHLEDVMVLVDDLDLLLEAAVLAGHRIGERPGEGPAVSAVHFAGRGHHAGAEVVHPRAEVLLLDIVVAGVAE